MLIKTPALNKKARQDRTGQDVIGLVIRVNAELTEKMSYDDLINDFAARKCADVPSKNLLQLLT